MYRYVVKRIIMLIPIVIGISLLVFVIMDLAPGSAVDYLSSSDATEEDIARLTAQLGLDKPLLVRYVIYMQGLIQGDMGKSFVSGNDVFATYMQKFPATLLLALSAVALAVIVSVPLGIYSAMHSGKTRDNAATIVTLVGLSLPNFWLGLLLIMLFSLNLGLLPSGGNFDGWKSLILPAVTLSTSLAAMIMRTTRSSMLDVMRQDYLRTARAKGVPEKRVINRHALKNALIPIINAIGIELGVCIGGAVITETVFSWPGVGRLIIDSLNSRDVPMVTGSIILKTITISIIMLIVDLLYAAVDPRIKVQYSRKKGW